MRVIEYRPGLPGIGDAVVALGLFDGVHLAHRALLAKAKRIADEKSLPLVAFTFPSGSEGLKAGRLPLYSTDEKLSLLASLGVDATVLADFPSVKDLSPAAFVSEVLLRDLHTRVAVFGYNFRFGRGAEGTADLLAALLAEEKKAAVILPPVLIDDAPSSTSRIRDLLEKSDLPAAAALLGAPYFLDGTVVPGRGVGHTLGAPTFNFESDPRRFSLPAGVYRTALSLDGKHYDALTNVGTCPTFGDRENHVETTVIGFSGDLYGQTLRLYFLEKIRDEVRFPDAGELARQIEADKAALKGKPTLWTESGPSLP